MNKEFRIYRPLKQGNGAASRLNYRKQQDDLLVFWQSAQQEGFDDKENAKFAWKDQEKSVSVKLGITDIGEILAVLNGKKEQAGTDKGIFHSNEKGNTSFTFRKQDNGYYLRVAKKNNAKLIEVKHGVSFGEGEILKILLGYIIIKDY